MCIRDRNIQCDFEIKASHIYSRNKNDAEILKHEVDIVNKLGFSAEYVSQSGLPFSIVGEMCIRDRLRYVHSKFHELSDRGTRHGTSWKRNDPSCLL